MLRNDLERYMQLVKNLERVKKEYEFLELQNEALNAKLDSKEATIRDLEDNIHVSFLFFFFLCIQLQKKRKKKFI